MGLRIDRRNDLRVVKCVLHRVADIPGGVAVKTSNLGGNALFEGTPLGVDSDGLYQVCKTAQIVTEVAASATTVEVAKGHHFQVGDYFAVAGNGGKAITAIDKTDSAKDVITLGAALSSAAIAADTCAYETTAADATGLKVTPVAIAGSNEDIRPGGDNLFVSAWVIAVVKEDNAPIVNDTIKEALRAVVYV